MCFQLSASISIYDTIQQCQRQLPGDLIVFYRHHLRKRTIEIKFHKNKEMRQKDHFIKELDK